MTSEIGNRPKKKNPKNKQNLLLNVERGSCLSSNFASKRKKYQIHGRNLC